MIEPSEGFVVGYLYARIADLMDTDPEKDELGFIVSDLFIADYAGEVSPLSSDRVQYWLAKARDLLPTGSRWDMTCEWWESGLMVSRQRRAAA